MDGKIEGEKLVAIGGKSVRPDFIIDFGDRGCVAISLKPIPRTNKSNSPMVSELEVFGVLNAFMHKVSEKAPCSFSFMEKDTQVFVLYDKGDGVIGFTGYEAIVCKRCFSNPSSPINGKVLFDDFVSLKDNNFSDIYDENYKQQVRSAVERVNKKLKAFYHIKEDILIYSSIPQVVINSIFLK